MNVRKEQIKTSGEVCDTIFYPGNNSSQTQALKYTGNQVLTATTGQFMWCEGRNNMAPLKVIYSLHIGPEIADVNLNPFNHWLQFFNPMKLVFASVTWASNWLNGFQFSSPTEGQVGSVNFHTPLLANFSIGQETDMRSHKKKYETWLESPEKTAGLILWGVSRGTAATFCAFAKEKYPEVKLVILEGAIDSVEEVLRRRINNYFKSETMAEKMLQVVNHGFSFFNRYNLMAYQPDGVSPLKMISEFPEGVPVVFITSTIDTIVPSENTKNIAQKLAARGKNDVYLLELQHSTHPNYMFDNVRDRYAYETFIHAILEKYGLQHDEGLAKAGRLLVEKNLLVSQELVSGLRNN